MTGAQPSLSDRMRRRPRSAAWGMALAIGCGVVVFVLCAGCFGAVLFFGSRALLGPHPPHPP